MKMRVLAALKLEKAIPFSHELGFIQLKLCDRARYIIWLPRRCLSYCLLFSCLNQKVFFSGFVVFCSAWCLDFKHIILHKIAAVISPKNLLCTDWHVSDVLWVSCASFNDCPQISELQINSLIWFLKQWLLQTQEVMFRDFHVFFLWFEISVLLCLQIQLTYFNPGSSVTMTPI